MIDNVSPKNRKSERLKIIGLMVKFSDDLGKAPGFSDISGLQIEE